MTALSADYEATVIMRDADGEQTTVIADRRPMDVSVLFKRNLDGIDTWTKSGIVCTNIPPAPDPDPDPTPDPPPDPTPDPSPTQVPSAPVGP